jgi:hypothetical protein
LTPDTALGKNAASRNERNTPSETPKTFRKAVCAVSIKVLGVAPALFDIVNRGKGNAGGGVQVTLTVAFSGYFI